MRFFNTKKGLLTLGIIAGLGAALLAYLGNPKNMAFCIACFIRDTAGAMKFHNAEVVQYFRPEIVGIILGAFLISLFTKEYRSTAGSSPVIRFFLGCNNDGLCISILRLSFKNDFKNVSRRYQFLCRICRICSRCCNRCILLKKRLQFRKSLSN